VPVTFDGLAGRFDDTMARVWARVAALDRAADELAGLRGHATSPGGEAEAVVDGGGGLVALWLADAVVRLTPETVGALIVETCHAAAADAARRRRGVLDTL